MHIITPQDVKALIKTSDDRTTPNDIKTLSKGIISDDSTTRLFKSPWLMTELCRVTWKHYLKRLAWYRTMQCSPKALFKWRATVVGCYWKEMHTKCSRFHFQKCSDWRNSTFRIYRKRPTPCQLATAPPSARKQPIKLHHRWTLGDGHFNPSGKPPTNKLFDVLISF